MNTNNRTLYIGIGVVIVLVIAAIVYIYAPSATETPAGETVHTTTTNTSASEDNDTSVASSGHILRPLVTTAALAVSVSSTTASVAGTVNPNGGTTTYWFEYGTTPTFTQSTIPKSVEAPGATAEAAVIGGLKPATPYYFRMGAKNSAGTRYGTIYSFITKPVN
jgi:hypothetical protein